MIGKIIRPQVTLISQGVVVGHEGRKLVRGEIECVIRPMMDNEGNHGSFA